MKLRKVAWVLFGVVLLMLLVIAAAWPRTQTAGGPEYTSNGREIAGWNWLRNEGEMATWTFDAAPLQNANATSVYLNFNPLVTNGVNGGSGYATTIKLTVVGRTQITLSITPTNPYRPIDPENSGGIGYPCYGHSSACLPASLWKGAKKITITAQYPFTPDRHVAVNKDCLYFGFSTGAAPAAGGAK